MVKKPETEALEGRTGLNEPLRVMLKEYPRAAWEGDPGFSDLIRFWLDRHLMFRRLLEVMQTEARTTLEKNMDPMTHASHLSRYGSMFAGELHGHHTIEDQHYFPKLKELEPEIAHGFDILDTDHQAIDGHLAAFADSANAVLGPVSQGKPDAQPLGALLDQLTGMEQFLERHLTDEEELVVPVLLKHGSRMIG